MSLISVSQFWGSLHANTVTANTVTDGAFTAPATRARGNVPSVPGRARPRPRTRPRTTTAANQGVTSPSAPCATRDHPPLSPPCGEDLRVALTDSKRVSRVRTREVRKSGYPAHRGGKGCQASFAKHSRTPGLRCAPARRAARPISRRGSGATGAAVFVRIAAVHWGETGGTPPSTDG